jgi:hypothetical protein
MVKIVFVHLGKSRVAHLFSNIEYLLKIFSGREIVVVSDNKRLRTRVESLGAFFWEFTSLSSNNIFNSLSRDLNFRDGFWKYSLQRFEAIKEFHNECRSTPLLHLESDVLLFRNFPLHSFENLQKLAWEGYNEERDVGAIFFSPSFHETDWLIKEISHEIAKDAKVTDMTALARIRKNNPDRILLLPGDPFKQQDFNGGFFDAAPIGMWLTGEDPRNHKGRVIKLNQHLDSDVDPSRFRYHVTESGMEVELGEGRIKLFNLHIHSKQTKYFEKNILTVLANDIKHSDQENSFSDFKFGIFVLICFQFVKRRLKWLLR